MRHFLKVTDLSASEILELVDAAKANKGEHSQALGGKSLGMIFAKPSTRTRVSFTVGVYELGGHLMFISEREMQLGRGETFEDTARVLSRYLDGVVIRTYSQADLERYAAASSIPVINGLTDERHPCQALADLMTISEFHDAFKGLKVAYFGDGNNVSNSLGNICAMMGMHVAVCTPPELEPPQWAMSEAKELAAEWGGEVEFLHDPAGAARHADFLYTDVWFSMGQQRNPEKQKQLEPYRIDSKLLSQANPECRVMHCLPAHRGEEISADVIDGPKSIIYQQAENRLHAQKELLKKLMGDDRA